MMGGQGNDLEGAKNSQKQSQKPKFNDDEDPINYLGLGISSYFHMLKVLMFTFLVLTVLHIPVMNIYASHGNFKEETGDRISLKVTLGSMGFSQGKCTSSGMASDRIVLSCKTGVIGKIVDFGLNAKFENRDLCVRNPNGVCKNTFNDKIVRKFKINQLLRIKFL